MVFEPHQSYWAKSQPPHNPPLTENITADVVLLGGGFTGLSSAYRWLGAKAGLALYRFTGS